jgi:hypothetical protein
MLSSHMAFKAYFLRSIGEKGSCDVVWSSWNFVHIEYSDNELDPVDFAVFFAAST